jgi:hypothetical protein
VIESVFANLKANAARTAPRSHTSRPRTPHAQRILALTLGMLFNTISGRPARALAAYDGR